jgi:hypothetical protein
VTSGPDLCAQAGLTLDHPYDARNFPLHTPIYYVAGQDDPLTPYARAAYDFTVQTLAQRTFILLGTGAGHDPLDTQLGVLGTANKFWDAVLLAPSLLPVAMAQAGWPATVTSASP